MIKLDFLVWVLIITGLALILVGLTLLPLDTQKSGVPALQQFTTESTVSHSRTEDSSAKKSSKIEESRTEKTVPVPPAAGPGKDLLQLRYDNAYKYILLGALMLLSLYLLPFVSNFSFLGMFSASMKEKADKNEVTESSVLPPSQPTAGLLAQVDPTPVGQKEIGLEAHKESQPVLIKYADDPQKDQWGGKSKQGGRLLSASIVSIPGTKQLFKVTLRVVSVDSLFPVKGWVRFHLHDSFTNPEPVIFALNGMATLTLTAWGAFTVGAEADNGLTRLELDLAQLPEAPAVFGRR
jgi:hypothetical protein